MQPLTVLTLAILSATQTAALEPPAPKQIPPITAIAQALPSKRADNFAYAIEIQLPSIRYEIVDQEDNAGSNWKPVHRKAIKAEIKSIKRTLKFLTPSQIPDSQVLDASGNELDQQTILKRLKQPTPILVSVDGKMVDPYYLAVARKDTIVIILSRKDGQGDANLLMKPKQ